MQGSESQVVRAGQANLPGNKQKIQMTHNPSGRTLRAACSTDSFESGTYLSVNRRLCRRYIKIACSRRGPANSPSQRNLGSY